MGNRVSKDDHPALCCKCGRPRMVTEWDSWGEPRDEEVAGAKHAYGRCYVWRKCASCGRQTMHAYLREDGKRDEIESIMMGVDVVRSAEIVVAESQIPLAVNWLVDHDVRMEWASDCGPDGTVGVITRYLDDGAFLVRVDPDADPKGLLSVLEQAIRIVRDPRAWIIWQAVPAIGGDPPLVFCPLGPILSKP